ncbi:hypothetical protein [Rugamonas sp.]|uniref:hypothetical protein n=1 Tax=Rugamonas sp. TaxID=1926287 RepID=UPI0025CF00D7|nr:hypothetical protein [Rugamonas sp.]
MNKEVSINAEASVSDTLWKEDYTASFVQLARGTLANARVTGSLGLPFIKLTPGKRGAVRYRKSDVEAWLTARTYKNTQQAVVAARNVEGA